MTAIKHFGEHIQPMDVEILLARDQSRRSPKCARPPAIHRDGPRTTVLGPEIAQYPLPVKADVAKDESSWLHTDAACGAAAAFAPGLRGNLADI